MIAGAEGEGAGGTFSGTNSFTPDLGLGIFSRFPLRVSASVQGGYDDNINTAHDFKQNSWFTTANIGLSYDVGTPRTQINLATSQGITYYFDAANNKWEPNLNLTLTVNHKASERLALTLTVYASYQTEPDFQYGLGTNRRAGNYVATQDKMSVSYMWTPRFSTNTSYTFSAVHYDSSGIGFFEDRYENTIGNEFRFLVMPTTNLVGEYRFEVTSYDGVQRDSKTQFALAGFDHAFTSRLVSSFRGGAEFRDYDQFGTKTSPYFEATLRYALGQDTAVAWTNRYGIEEGDVALNPTRTTFRTGLQGTHKFTARIEGAAELYYTHDNYDSATIPPGPGGNPPGSFNPAFTEDTFNASLSLRYAVTRYLNVQTAFDHAEVSSGIDLRSYSRNRIWGGLNVTF